MALFRKVKIVHKLSVVTGVLVIGFGGVGAAYLAQQRVHGAVGQQTALLNEFAAATALTRSKAIESEVVLKDFFQQRNLALLEAFNKDINEANNGTATLEKLAQNERQQELIAQLRDALSAYQRAAKTATDAVIASGINENSGTLGALRTIARELEEGMQRLQEEGGTNEEFSKLQILYLSMRRHEKDYLARLHESDIQRLQEVAQKFIQTSKASSLPAAGQAQLTQLAEAYYNKFTLLVDLIKTREPAYAKLHQQQDLMESLAEALVKVTHQALEVNEQAGQAEIRKSNAVFLGVLSAVAGILIISMVTLALDLTRSLRRLQTTMQNIAEGNEDARTQMGTGDELATLGQTFDTMLDERAAYLAATERERAARLAEAEAENDALNTSIVALIQAVSQLSQKDLTVRVPVSEDMTGTVADALNMLVDETADVLSEVTRISENVATASRSVKVQSDAVIALADTEREQVLETAEQLATAAVAMNDIAALAQTCNLAAESAIAKTQTALSTVTSTVEGIHTIRDTIRETEKRIKRLGERSQEISGAVSLINSIAERTHILALNASMHAASAGEAGRGFAVVADEVQRLAENARQSTEQIAQLVTNIQTETTDTVNTMNTVITQVVEGSRLAGQAGEQMRQTQQSTAELVASVRQIAVGAQAQAKVSNILRDRAGSIVESTHKTSEQLMAQGGQTARLLEYAGRLVRAVRVFRLPTHRMDIDTDAHEEDEHYTIQMRIKEDALLEESLQP
jgi:methyl-accepting chemotaxis protein